MLATFLLPPLVELLPGHCHFLQLCVLLEQHQQQFVRAVQLWLPFHEHQHQQIGHRCTYQHRQQHHQQQSTNEAQFAAYCVVVCWSVLGTSLNCTALVKQGTGLKIERRKDQCSVARGIDNYRVAGIQSRQWLTGWQAKSERQTALLVPFNPICVQWHFAALWATTKPIQQYVKQYVPAEARTTSKLSKLTHRPQVLVSHFRAYQWTRVRHLSTN